jgi:hypothetical protein
VRHDGARHYRQGHDIRYAVDVRHAVDSSGGNHSDEDDRDRHRRSRG